MQVDLCLEKPLTSAMFQFSALEFYESKNLSELSQQGTKIIFCNFVIFSS